MHLEKVKIKRIIGPTPSGAAVLLGNDKKTFVVFVGFYEAAAILREINHEVPARPLTQEVTRDGEGPFRVPEQPALFVGAPRGGARPAPRLGEHDSEILSDPAHAWRVNR